MQIGNNLLNYTSFYQSSTKQSSNNTTNQTPTDVLIDSIFDKMGIEKKVEQKQQNIERTLTGYGEKSTEETQKVAKMSAQIYKAVLENELKDKISQMSLKEQATKVNMEQLYGTYSQASANKYDSKSGSSLSLSA